MMNKFWDSPWVYRVLSLFIAVALFAYVNAEKIDNSIHTNKTTDSAVLATKTVSISAPLEINADLDKYYVTGFPEKVKVKVEGNAALVTTLQNTQNFRVVANLRKLSVGSHTVRLQVQGLSNNLTYKVDPATIKVNIQNRISKTMAVQVDYNKSAIADGYTAGSPVLSTANVQVTGARSEIERIYEVSASLALARNTHKNITQTVTLQALDSNGHTLDVMITPQTVRVKLPISMPSKKVPLTFKQTGKAATGRSYAFESNTESVMIYGKKSVLQDLDSLEVPIDVGGIDTTTKKTIDLTAIDSDLASVKPGSAKVTIKVTNSKSLVPEADSSATAKSSSSASSSSDSDSSSSK